jgi:hypothetical protein
MVDMAGFVAGDTWAAAACLAGALAAVGFTASDLHPTPAAAIPTTLSMAKAIN